MGFASTGQSNTGNQTGVGSSTTNTSDSQPTNSQFGGKGGGTPTGTNPYAAQSTSTAQRQSYMPMGGTAFGYNAGRLANRMDPSATLPGEYQQPQQPQQPQFNFQDAFGGKGGGEAAKEEPTAPEFFDKTPAPAPAPADQYADRFSALEEKLNKLLSGGAGTDTTGDTDDTGRRAAVDDELKDTGEGNADLPKGFEEFGVGMTEGEKADAAAADAAAKAKIDPLTGKPRYEYSKYELIGEDKLAALGDKANIGAYFTTNINRANADIKEAKAALARAQKAGNVDAMAQARTDLAAANEKLSKIKADQKTVTSRIGKSGYQTAAQIEAANKAAADKKAADAAAKQKAAADAAAKKRADADAKKAAADKKKADAAAKKAAADKKKADAAAKKKADAEAKKAAKPAKKNASGGIIHNGMSNRLKHMLGEK